MTIAVLGPLVVDDDGMALAPRDRVVLAALAVRHGEVVSGEMLADALWSGQPPPASWAKVVQGCVVRLRKALGHASIETRGGGYRLALLPEEVDANRFERLLVRARELVTLGEPDRAVFVVDEALGLWRGRALAELEEWEHGRIEAARLEELRLDAEELRIEAALQAGRYREVLADAQARVAQAPLREHRWMLLALAQHAAGRQGDALRTLHQARQVLVRELGLDPCPDLVALEGAILRQDPSLIAARPLTLSPVCPYRGLAAYDVGDTDMFFGREPEIGECLERLRRTGVLAVVGPSGSGKSSLVRAGIAAALQRDGHRVVVISPGVHPMDALAALPRTGASAVLIVDQCEEATTLCTNADERARFFAALLSYADSATVIVGLRADRLGELTAFPAFATLVERGLYLLRNMNSDHLRAAIETPARQAGLLLEPGLTDLLIRDVEGEPGSLPLLSHALCLTWERREGATLTVAGYQASGGIRGAVAQSAEQVYEREPPARRQMLRDLMMRLVAPSPDGEPVRSRVPRRVAAPDSDREELVDALVEARLVTSDAESVELAHEALARAWPRLREWLDDDVEGQRIWRHLATTADTWDGMGRPDSEVYRGARLTRVMEWRQRTDPVLNETEREFLEAGMRLADSERAVAEQQVRRQARTNRRLRALAAGVAVLAVAATVAGVAATRQARRADREAGLARAHELAASAIGVIEEDPSVARLLAVAAADLGVRTLATDAALHRAWAADLAVARWGFTGEVGVLSADISPTGDRLAAAGVFQDDGSGWTVQVVNPYTDELVWSVDLSESGAASAFVAEPFFTADGEQVVAGVFWDPYNWRRVPIAFDDVDEPMANLLGANFWDATTGELIDRIDLGRCGGVVTAVSPTHILARTLQGPPDVMRGCRWRDGSVGVELIDRGTGEHELLTTATNTMWQWGAALSDDGKYVAFDDGAAGEVVVIDLESGAEVLRRLGSGVHGLNEDGSLLLVGQQPIEVWDVAARRVVSTFDGHNGPSFNARFGPTGHTVYSDGDDGALREWDATTGSELFSYPDLGNGPLSLNAAGLVAVSNPDQQVVTIIDTRQRGEVGAVDTCDGAGVPDTLNVVGGIAAVHEACDGEQAATTYLIDLDRGETLATISGREYGALAVSPDGTRMVDQRMALGSAGREASGVLTISDMRAGSELMELERVPDRTEWPHAERLRWSPDGRWIAAALGSELAVWNASDGSLVQTASAGGDAAVSDVLFTPDSASLLATTSDRRITARQLGSWDDVAGETLFVDGAYRLALVGFVPDGSSLIAIGGFQMNTSSSLVWLDPETFDQQRQVTNIHEGSVTAAALGDGGSLLATGASDGSVRVWDTATGELVHEVPGGGSEIDGIAFVGDRHLAVAQGNGEVLTITVDSAELLRTVRDSLTKGLTLSECQRFNFGDHCPTLAELRESTTAGPDTLAGTFQITWSRDELVATAMRDTTEWYGAAPVAGIFDDLATGLAGTYRVTFADGRFDIGNDRRDDPVCAGTYLVVGDHVWLRSERGDSCYPIKLLDAVFDVTDDELRFDPIGLRAEYPWALVLASRPLQRVS